jgi:hypothetical protein
VVTRTAGIVALRGCGFDAHVPAGAAGAEEARAAGELVLGLAAPTGGICHGGGGESTRRVRAYPVRGADQAIAEGRIGPRDATDADPPNRGRADIGPMSVVTRQLEAFRPAVSARGASRTFWPPLTAGEPFEQALAHALDALG